jgi:Lipase (class 3)
MAGQDPPPTDDWLNLATLYLCKISYATDIVTIPGLVLSTPTPTSDGIWRCLWGPVQSSDESNLAFVAGYSPQPGLAVEKICVTIRGTDIDVTDIWGILAQVWEDIDATSQVSVSWKGWDSSTRIAKGTSEGLSIIMGLTEKKVSLGEFLKGFLGTASNKDVTTLVTGHSLGACLATVVAPWIESIRPDSYKGTIQPITFAGPTAGNGDFATQYATKFPEARRFQNTLDIIPRALENLLDIPVIYTDPLLLAPELVLILIAGMWALLHGYGITYVQPVQNPSQGKQMLTGTFTPKTSMTGTRRRCTSIILRPI